MWTAINWIGRNIYGDSAGEAAPPRGARYREPRDDDVQHVARLALAHRLEAIAPRTMLADRRRGCNAIADAASELCAALVRHIGTEARDAMRTGPLSRADGIIAAQNASNTAAGEALPFESNTGPIVLTIVDAIATAVATGSVNERRERLHQLRLLAVQPKTVRDRAMLHGMTSFQRRRQRDAECDDTGREARRAALRDDIVSEWCAVLNRERRTNDTLRAVDIVARVAQSSRRFVNTSHEFDAWLADERTQLSRHASAEATDESQAFSLLTLQFDDDNENIPDTMRRGIEPFVQAIHAVRTASASGGGGGGDVFISADFLVDVAIVHNATDVIDSNGRPRTPTYSDDNNGDCFTVVCQCAFRVRARFSIVGTFGMDAAMGGDGIGVKLRPATLQTDNAEVITTNTSWTLHS